MSSASKPVAVKRVAKKESPAATVAAPAPAPVAAVVVAAPAKEKKSKASPAAVAAPAPIPSAPIQEAPAASAIAAANTVVEPTTTVAQDIESLTAQLQSVRDAAITGLKALTKLSKRVAREVKEAGRRRRVRKAAPVEGAVKRPTIFTTPVTLRDSLCSFLGKPNGSQMTPADVTRAFSAYVDSHKLKDAEKGHTIHPDAAMRKVLGVKEGEALTYRNIQTYLYKLYDLPKKASASATA